MGPLIAFSLGLTVQLMGASSLVAKEVIRAGDTVTAANISTEAGDMVDADNPLIGREVRRTVYVGQELTLLSQRVVSPQLRVTQASVIHLIRGWFECAVCRGGQNHRVRGERWRQLVKRAHPVVTKQQYCARVEMGNQRPYGRVNLPGFDCHQQHIRFS